MQWEALLQCFMTSQFPAETCNIESKYYLYFSKVGLLLYNMHVTLMTLVRCRLLIFDQKKQPVLIEKLFFNLELISLILHP